MNSGSRRRYALGEFTYCWLALEARDLYGSNQVADFAGFSMSNAHARPVQPIGVSGSEWVVHVVALVLPDNYPVRVLTRISAKSGVYCRCNFPAEVGGRRRRCRLLHCSQKHRYRLSCHFCFGINSCTPICVISTAISSWSPMPITLAWCKSF